METEPSEIIITECLSPRSGFQLFWNVYMRKVWSPYHMVLPLPGTILFAQHRSVSGDSLISPRILSVSLLGT